MRSVAVNLQVIFDEKQQQQQQQNDFQPLLQNQHPLTHEHV